MRAQPSYQPSFRAMTQADLDAVMRIEPTIYSHPWTRGNFKDSLDSDHRAWLMEVDHVLVGYAVVMHVLDEAHLLNISIASAWQGQGFGRLLLAQMMTEARQQAAANMFLEVRASNHNAIGLYEALGFCEMGIRRNYYPAEHKLFAGGREDAVLMGAAL